MIPEEGFDNAHTINAGNGRNTLGNSPNVEDAEEQNTAVRNVRRVPGYSTDTGVSLLLNSTRYNDPQKHDQRTAAELHAERIFLNYNVSEHPHE